jgi:hypothetical protein
VLDTPAAVGAAADACAVIDPTAAALAVAYENRPNSYGEHDHTPSGEPFHGFTKMELTAVPSELSTIPKGIAVFMEPRENAIRTHSSQHLSQHLYAINFTFSARFWRYIVQ